MILPALSTNWTVAIQCPLCRNISLMRKTLQPYQSGDLRSFSNILKVPTYQKKRLKDCLNFFVAALWVSEPSKD